MEPDISIFDKLPMNPLTAIILFAPLVLGCSFYLYKLFSYFVLGEKMVWNLSNPNPMRFWMTLAITIALISGEGIAYVLPVTIGCFLLVTAPIFLLSRFDDLK